MQSSERQIVAVKNVHMEVTFGSVSQYAYGGDFWISIVICMWRRTTK